MKMLIRVACLLMVLGVSAKVAGAQAQPPASGPGSFISVGGGVSAYQADYGKRVLGGFVAYVDMHPEWRYGIEGEARFLRYHTDQDVTEQTYLVGPKVYALRGNLRPYGKFLIGAGKIVLPFNYAQGTFLTYAPGAGIDYLVTDRISLRVIDFEYQQWPQFTFGALHPYGLSAGVNFRLNRVERYPRH